MAATFKWNLCIRIQYTLSNSRSYILENPQGVCSCRMLDYMGNKELGPSRMWLHHCFYLSHTWESRWSGEPACIHCCDRYRGGTDSGKWIMEEYITWHRRNMDAANSKADFLYTTIHRQIFMSQLENWYAKGKLSKLNLWLEGNYYINKFITNDQLYYV